jgi:hypothetical protein
MQKIEIELPHRFALSICPSFDPHIPKIYPIHPMKSRCYYRILLDLFHELILLMDVSTFFLGAYRQRIWLLIL